MDSEKLGMMHTSNDASDYIVMMQNKYHWSVLIGGSRWQSKHLNVQDFLHQMRSSKHALLLANKGWTQGEVSGEAGSDASAKISSSADWFDI